MTKQNSLILGCFEISVFEILRVCYNSLNLSRSTEFGNYSLFSDQENLAIILKLLSDQENLAIIF